jgi:hypothetical protein
LEKEIKLKRNISAKKKEAQKLYKENEAEHKELSEVEKRKKEISDKEYSLKLELTAL